MRHISIQILFLSIDAVNEFTPKYDCFGGYRFYTAFNSGGIKTKIEWNRPCTSAKYPEIDGQPFETVGHQMDDPILFLNSPGDEELGHLIGLIVKFLPGNFPAGKKPFKEGRT